MLSKILLGLSITSLVCSFSLGWLLKNQYQENGKLHQSLNELSRDIADFELANLVLSNQIDSLLAESEWLVAKIKTSEDQKRQIRSQLEVTNNELRKALSNSPEFEAYQLPDPVARVIDSQLSRLWPKNADSGENRNQGRQTASP